VVTPQTGTAAANFSATPTTLVGPGEVTFSDASSGATSWLWNFGDGGTSTLQNPKHTYAAVTSTTQYSVTLEINGGTTAPLALTRQNYITVQPAAVLTASFSGTPRTVAVNGTVSFTESSTGGPTSWSWNFGDGGTSTAQNPTHVYSSAGSFTVSLQVSNASGNDTETQTGYITVTSGGGGTPTNVVADGDAQVQTGNLTKNYGTLGEMRVRSGSPEYRAYVKFTVPAGTSPSSLKLRMFASDGGPSAGDVYVVGAGSWTEGGLNWNNQPIQTPPAGKTAVGGSVANGAWYEWDVSSAIVANQTTYSFAIITTNTNSVTYDSREAANKPTLVVS
jgi:PKD repeat protein